MSDATRVWRITKALFFLETCMYGGIVEHHGPQHTERFYSFMSKILDNLFDEDTHV